MGNLKVTHFVLNDEFDERYSLTSEVVTNRNRIKVVNSICSTSQNDYPRISFESDTKFLNLLLDKMPMMENRSIETINADFGNGRFLMKFIQDRKVLIIKLIDNSRKGVMSRFYYELNVESIEFNKTFKQCL